MYNQLFITMPVFIRDFVDTGDIVDALRHTFPSSLDFLAAVNLEQLQSVLPKLADQYAQNATAEQLRQIGFELVNYKIMVPPEQLAQGLEALRIHNMNSSDLAQMWVQRYRQINPEYIVNLDFGAIVLCQIAISAYIQRWRALPILVAGTLILSLGIILCGTGHALLIGGFTAALAVIVFAFGEMVASPKSQEYVAAIAPKNKTAMFMGYYFVSMALGNLFGGLLSGWAYTAIAKEAQQPMLMWALFAAIGCLSAIAMLIFDRRLRKQS